MLGYKSTNIPTCKGTCLSDNSDELFDDPTLYTRLVTRLLNSNIKRPDIIFNYHSAAKSILEHS